MSYESLARSNADQFFRQRIAACCVKEAQARENTASGQVILNNPYNGWESFVWPVCINAEASYESGVASEMERPDLNVQDGEILSAVQGEWDTTPIVNVN